MSSIYVVIVNHVAMDTTSENIYVGQDVLRITHAIQDYTNDGPDLFAETYLEIETWEDGRLISRELIKRL